MRLSKSLMPSEIKKFLTLFNLLVFDSLKVHTFFTHLLKWQKAVDTNNYITLNPLYMSNSKAQFCTFTFQK